MSGLDRLEDILRRIDRRGYKAYKDIAGSYDAGQGLSLHIDHVQGDPFAAPSKLRLRMDQSAAELPAELFDTPTRRIALADYLARAVRRAIEDHVRGHRGSGKSGAVAIDAGRQEVLERSAVVITESWVEARITVGLPAAGRSVLAREAIAILCDELPEVADAGLLWSALDADRARDFVHCVDNQQAIRDQLGERKLIAFVADCSILPRASGASDRPMPSADAVPFQSPEALRVRFELAHPLPSGERHLQGMGIPEGVTLVVGGGYHGKSTLLEAVQRGVYPHVPGDGREYVVTRPDAVKIRAEDGRRVEAVDITPFIGDLPGGRSTRSFRSSDASGSTSQAANIVEAIEVGARVLLLDEDTSATNFMVRDARMQALVHARDEPITPFVDRVRELYDTLGVSTLLVMGGSGDYFDAADTVVMMRDYHPHDATAEAHRIASQRPSQRQAEARGPLPAPTPRIPEAKSFDPSRGRRSVKIDARGVDLIRYGEEDIELGGVEQLVDPSQARAVGHAIHLAIRERFIGSASLSEVLDQLDAFFEERGLDPLDPFHRPGEHPGSYARPRRFELAAAINRLRSLKMHQQR